ncbi:HepT-like ribonuclease domain-containing protein [uncultured Methanospirillum sp.]|nr:HepT-like ribonuclease domain-containing protein [uncultured Methanospirillum sp.]
MSDGYFSIDYSIVWNVITNDIPEIKPKIFSLFKELEKQYQDSQP